MFNFFIVILFTFISFNSFGGIYFYYEKDKKQGLTAAQAVTSELMYDKYQVKVPYNDDKKNWVDFFNFSKFSGLPYNLIFVSGSIKIDNLNKKEVDSFIFNLINNSTKINIVVYESQFNPFFNPKTLEYYIEFNSEPFESYYNLLGSDNPSKISFAELKKILDELKIKNNLPNKTEKLIQQFYKANNRFVRKRNQDKIEEKNKTINVFNKDNNIIQSNESHHDEGTPKNSNSRLADSSAIKSEFTDQESSKTNQKNSTYTKYLTTYKYIYKNLSNTKKALSTFRNKVYTESKDVAVDIKNVQETYDMLVNDITDKFFELKSLQTSCLSSCDDMNINILFDDINNLQKQALNIENELKSKVIKLDERLAIGSTLYSNEDNVPQKESSKSNSMLSTPADDVGAAQKNINPLNDKFVERTSPVSYENTVILKSSTTPKTLSTIEPELGAVSEPASMEMLSDEIKFVDDIYFSESLIAFYADVNINMVEHQRDFKNKLKNLRGKIKRNSSRDSMFKKVIGVN